MTSDEPSATPSWKRPWSLNEIISFSNKWSLAGDSGVCELLKRFSSELLNEVSQVGHNVAELQIESKQLNVIMENVSNDLCMLANDQFMENLVEDVDSSQHSSVVPEGIIYSKEERNARVVPLVARALKMGLVVLENQFEVLDGTRMGSVSQNFIEGDIEIQTLSTCDFPTNEPIYQPKDPYEDRHLPHLIGTSDFIEDDTLGIGYIDDMDEIPEMTPDSLSNASPPNERTDYLTSSSSEDEKPAESKIPHVDSSEESDGMFDTKSISAPEIRPSQEPEEVERSRPLSLTEQLNKQMKERLSVSVKPSEKIVPPVQRSPPSIIKSMNRNLEPVKTTVPDSSLFWSDEEDLFCGIAAKTTEAPVAVSKTSSSSSLAPGNAPSLSQTKMNNGPSLSQPKPTVITKDDSESDDDIFKTSTSQLPAKQKEVPVVAAPRRTRKSTSTTSDTDDDLFGKAKPPTHAVRATSSIKSSVPASKTQPPSGTKKAAPVTKTLTFSSDDDDDDLFSAPTRKPTLLPARIVPGPTSSTVVAPPDSKRPAKVGTAVTKIEEDEDDDDDLFPPSIPNKNAPLKIASTVVSRTDKETPTTVPGGSNSTKTESKDDTDDEDDLFPSLSNKMKSSVPPASNIAKEGPITLPGLNRSIVPSKGIEGLSDDDDDDLFPAPRASQRPSIKQVAPSSKVAAKDAQTGHINVNEVTSKESQKVTTKTDTDDDDDDLFPVAKPTKTAHISPVSTVPPQSSTVKDTPPAVLDNNQSARSQKTVYSDPFSDEDPAVDRHIKTVGQDGPLAKERAAGPARAPSVISETVHSAVDEGVPPLQIVAPVQPTRKIPAGAVSMFGGPKQSSKNILEELNTRNRLSRMIVHQDLNDDDVDVLTPEAPNSREEPPEKLIASHRTSFLPSMSPFPTMQTSKGSPEDEKEISLDTPANAVNQLSNLTKSRARVSARRRPITKMADTLKVEKEVIIEEVQKESRASVTSEQRPTAKIADTPTEEKEVVIEEIQKEPSVSQGDTALPLDVDDIFANLPGPSKKVKTKKKDSSRNKKIAPSAEVDINEIDDIFAIAGSGTSKTGAGKKTKNKSVASLANDPLGAL